MPLLESIDHQIFTFINQTLSHTGIDFFMSLITWLGKAKWLMVMGWALFMILNKKPGRIIGLMMLPLVGLSNWLCESVLKPFFQMPRPFERWDDVRVLLSSTDHLSAFSLPSSHAANIVTLMSFLFFVYPQPRQRAVWILLALWVVSSRVYVGVHSPLDVTAGSILGMMVGGGGFMVYKIIKKRMKKI